MAFYEVLNLNQAVSLLLFLHSFELVTKKPKTQNDIAHDDHICLQRAWYVRKVNWVR